VPVPYFKAGLENNERCLWVTGRAFDAEQARSALRAIVPDFDKRERDKHLEIANFDAWYATGRGIELLDLLELHASQAPLRASWRRAGGFTACWPRTTARSRTAVSSGQRSASMNALWEPERDWRASIGVPSSMLRRRVVVEIAVAHGAIHSVS
jgi:hypothetical protein